VVQSRTQGAVQAARVLVVASDATATAPVCAELMRRGALCSVAGDIKAAAQAARETAFDTILVAAREGAPETTLLLQLLKAEANGSPRILLLLDPQHATAYAKSAHLADSMLASTLAPERIAEAAGVSVISEPVYNLPAVVEPDRAKILVLPAPMSAEYMPHGVAQQKVRGDVPDVVILTDPSAVNLISSWMSAAAAAVVPVIDASGRSNLRADASMSAVTETAIDRILSELAPMTQRMRELPESYFETRDARSMLLARLAVRERGADIQRDANLQSTVRYRDEIVIAGVVPVSESLVRTGHMTRKFFDRLHSCPTCTSARLNVREECSKCRSADVVEEPIIHHLRCGYQGPERDFKSASSSDMTCPKCRLHLEHFSVDYDKPGSLFLCNDCGHTTGDTAIGFVCLDCSSHHDAEQVKTKTFYAYELTDNGRHAAYLNPIAERGDGRGASGPTLRDRVRTFVAKNRNGGRPYSLLMIRLDQTGQAKIAAGERLWRDTVALYASILRELFTAETEIVEMGEAFIVMISGEPRERIDASLADIRNELERTLTVAVGARYDVLAPEQLEAMV
jgi:Thaumarchaeal output domain 1